MTEHKVGQYGEMVRIVAALLATVLILLLSFTGSVLAEVEAKVL